MFKFVQPNTPLWLHGPPPRLIQQPPVTLNISSECLPNSCCGARIKSKHSVYPRKGIEREYGTPFFLTQTLGINIFPGKVSDYKTYPNEELVDIPIGGNTLSIAFVSKFEDLNTLCSKDPNEGSNSGENQISLMTFTENKNDVTLYCPVFDSWMETDQNVHWAIRDFGYTRKQAEEYTSSCISRFKGIKELHDAGKPLLFIVTTSQEVILIKHLEKYGMDSSIKFHRTKLCNMNYSRDENPRLAIIYVEGKK